jgi:subfamily B ATP-binding cassette protein MsbA
MEKRFLIRTVLRPHWKTLLVAFVAVIFESLTDVFEPWPIKIVLDYVIGSKQLPEWLISLVTIAPGHDKQAILNFAAIAVITIAIISAISSYTEDYLTTKIGQWVMHDLRHDLYHHIQRLSLLDYDKQKTGDLISRITSDRRCDSGLCFLGPARNSRGHNYSCRDAWHNVLAQLETHSDRSCNRAASFS